MKGHTIKLNYEDIERYKKNLERMKTRYQIVDTAEQEDGSIVIHVKKQYNDRVDISEYFA